MLADAPVEESALLSIPTIPPSSLVILPQTATDNGQPRVRAAEYDNTGATLPAWQGVHPSS